MKLTSTAKCTIANELLRRRTQRARLRSRASGKPSPASSSREPPTRRRAAREQARKFLTPEKHHGLCIERFSELAHSNRPALGLSRRRSNMWKAGLNADRKHIFTGLRPDAERASVRAQINQLPDFHDGSSNQTLPAQQSTQEWISRTNQQQRPGKTPHTHIHSPRLGEDEDDECRSSPPRTAYQVTQSMASFSPCSDATLYEPHSPLQGAKLWDAPSYDVPKSDQIAFPRAITFRQDQDQTPTPAQRRSVRHGRQDFSTGSPVDTARTPTVPLSGRDRAHDGLLQLKANRSREPTTPSASRKTHRRRISLQLPVNTPMIKTNGSCQNDSRVGPRTALPGSTTDEPLPFLSPDERELEYKHRHTFIGTTSLDDFLETLETTARHTTTKGAVTKSFIQLAATEQVQARQHSSKQHGWELVSRITPEIPGTDYVVQMQVKLGSVTLRRFLDLIPFSGRDEVDAQCVVEAFLAACHLDAGAVGAGGRARRFRRWMVGTGEGGDGRHGSGGDGSGGGYGSGGGDDSGGEYGSTRGHWEDEGQGTMRGDDGLGCLVEPC